MANNNNGSVMLKRSWLIIIIIAAIGSPFIAFGTYRERVNTLQKTVQQHQQELAEHSTAITRIETKLDIIIEGLGLQDR